MELDMTKGSPTKLIVRFIIPIIIGNIFQQLYSMADTIIVGHFVGVKALAAVGATGSITFLILGFTQGLTTGFTVLTAQRFGAGDKEGMKHSIGSAYVLSAILAVLMTILSVTQMDKLLYMMNTPEDIYAMTKTYIIIICLGISCNVLYNLLASIMRAIGNSVIPLIFLVLAAALNVGLDLLFIAVFGMGVEGAAYATIISQGVSGILCLIYMLIGVPALRIERRHFRLEWQCVKNQLIIGLPMALQYSITAIGTILVQSALNLLGSTVVAAYSVAGKVEQFVTQPYGAMGTTMATYGAQNRGVNDLGRIKKGVKSAVMMTVIYSVVIYGVMMLVLPLMVRLFIAEAEVAAVYGYVRTYAILCGAFFIPLGLIFVFRHVLQGCGFGVLPMLGGVVELFSRAIVAFAAAKQKSYIGVCFANVTAWTGAAVFFVILFILLMRYMERKKTAYESLSESSLSNSSPAKNQNGR